MKQRCENPLDAGYVNYGARGIRFQFKSVLEAGIWIVSNLGLHRGMELDRKDNNGDYAPGNLRYATHRNQQYNKRTSKLTLAGFDWSERQSPLSFNTTRRMLVTGVTKEQIVERAKLAVVEKRKNWRGIQARLELLGYMTS